MAAKKTTDHPVYKHLMAAYRGRQPGNPPRFTVAELEAEFGPGSVRQALERHMWSPDPLKPYVVMVAYRDGTMERDSSAGHKAGDPCIVPVTPDDLRPTDHLRLRWSQA